MRKELWKTIPVKWWLCQTVYINSVLKVHFYLYVPSINPSINFTIWLCEVTHKVKTVTWEWISLNYLNSIGSSIWRCSITATSCKDLSFPLLKLLHFKPVEVLKLVIVWHISYRSSDCTMKFRWHCEIYSEARSAKEKLFEVVLNTYLLNKPLILSM